MAQAERPVPSSRAGEDLELGKPTHRHRAPDGGESRRVATLRALSIRAVTSAWHAGVDLERVPGALAFVIYERLRARAGPDGKERPPTCAELYPFVKYKWQVDRIDLSDCRDWLGEQCLSALCYVPSLRHVTLIGSLRVGDGGMAFLRAQCALCELDVSWCSRLTDGAIQYFGHLAGTLRSLNLTGTAITDAALTSVIHLTRLQRLGIGSTAVTDLGIEYLTYYSRYPAAGQQQGVPELEWLSLASTSVTDAGLLKLCAIQGGVVLKKLRLLVLSSTHALSGKAVNEVRLKYKFIAPLPNTPRTLASTNRDAMLGEAWLTRIAPADDRRATASRLVDARPVEASWVDDGLKHYMHRFAQEVTTPDAGLKRQRLSAA